MASSPHLRSVRSLSLVTIPAILQMALSPTAAHGGIITLESQQRYVDVNTNVGAIPSQDQRQSAPGFAPFNGEVSIDHHYAAETHAILHPQRDT